VDFNGDGEPSWYAGGLYVAHPRMPTPVDPLRYTSVALPTVTLSGCPSCTPRPAAFAVADLNRDGKQDIARVDKWQGQLATYTLSVFLGDGNDGFTKGYTETWVDDPNSPSGFRDFQLALADFDLDGDPDLAILSTFHDANTTVSPPHYEGSLRIRWNTPGALGVSFATETILQSRDLSDASRLIVDDFDRDGDVDIMGTSQYLFSNNSANLRLFRNDRAQTFTVSNIAGSVLDAAADLDRDGWLDYLTYNGAAKVIERSMNNHAGNWTSGTNFASSLDAGTPLAMVVADFDEDGIPDLIAAEGSYASNTSKNLTLHRGRDVSSGTVGAGELIATLPADIRQIGMGDARGDADQDLLLRLSDGSFRFVRNTAQRLAPLPPSTTSSALIEPGAGLSRLGVADSNRDGVDDVFMLNPSGNKLRRALGNGNNGFAPSEFKTLSGPATDFTLGDFNRDGRTDIAYVEPVTGVVRTVTQNDSVYFGWLDTKIADYAGAGFVRAGNGNYNDSTDLLVASNSTGGLRWFLNQADGMSWTTSDRRASYLAMPNGLAVAPHYNTNMIGDTAFACNADATSFEINGYSPINGHDAGLMQTNSALKSTGVCATANLDRDADQELVFVNGNGYLVAWSPLVPGSIIVTRMIDADPQGTVNAIVPVDWNRDGLDDLLVATTQGLYLYMREGVMESWQRHGSITGLSGINAEVKDVATIDVNRDSRPDAVFLAADGLHVAYNVSYIVGTAPATAPVTSPASVMPGQQGVALAFGVVNPGRHDEDASIAVTGLRVQFLAAVQSNGAWSPGGALTSSQVQEAVASVSILMDGLVIGTKGTGAVQVDGSLQIDYVAGLGSIVPISADAAKDLQVRVALKPTADSASYQDFFLQHYDSSGGAAVLFGNDPVGRSGTLYYGAHNLVHIGDEIFKDGFD